MAQVCQVVSSISIHALLAESDSAATQGRANAARFLSTLSLRRATLELKPISNFGLISIHALLAESDSIARQVFPGRQYFYPRSPCGERLDSRVTLVPHQQISIHALLAESDVKLAITAADEGLISIHALLAESDSTRWPYTNFHELFLSTLSLRRATANHRPHSRWVGISIHALLAESD